jgi:beta-galactosidase
MKHVNFTQGWEFQKANAETWQAVNLPHDAMIHEKRDPDCVNGTNTGFFPGGKYVYRKQFDAPAAWADQCVLLEFEGVYRNSTVLINGKIAGEHRYGYTGFTVNVAPFLAFGGSNEIVVTVDNSEEPNSRWYTGSGIYNNVHLIVGRKTHIERAGVKVITKSIAPAWIEIEIKVLDGEALQPEVRTEVFFDGKTVATGSGATQRIEIKEPHLWSDETPNLYGVKAMLVAGDQVIDEVTERFGLRVIEWDAKTGLRINGKVTKLRGACIHTDNGILGACSYAAAEERKIKRLKEAGFNAIRSSHNPLPKAALNACDQYGLYVMDETFDQWYIPKTKFDYARDFTQSHRQDIEAMVNKDFNHPSVILYSIGNEVSETAQPKGVQLAKEMAEFVHALDNTRPVAAGINLFLNGLVSIGKGIYSEENGGRKESPKKKPAAKKEKLSGSAFINAVMNSIGVFMNYIGRLPFVDKATRDVFSVLDIAGYNYGRGRYALEGKAYPGRVVVGSETFPPELYQNWELVKKYPYLIGDFQWTGWDYLGEGGLGAVGYESRGGANQDYPYLTSDCGVIDLTGQMRPEVYFNQAVWGLCHSPYIGVEPLTHAGEKRVFPMWRKSDAVASWSWTGCEGKTAEVRVYSDSDSVEIFLNGRSLGKKKVKTCVARFKATYEKGELLAVAFDKAGKETGRCSLVSAGEKIQLSVKPEKVDLKANGADLAYIQIELTDDRGILESGSDRRIHVTVEGAGVLLGLGSANPHTEEGFDQAVHYTYFGRALATICSGTEAGLVKVTVSADGLEGKETILRVHGD